MVKRKKKQLTINLPQDIIDWMDKKIEDLTFSSKSHAIERALKELKERMEMK